MTRVIDGSCYLGILSSGIKNLDKHKTVLNELNVFPVPDGDTGTNMVMTLKSGIDAAERAGSSLCGTGLEGERLSHSARLQRFSAFHAPTSAESKRRLSKNCKAHSAPEHP